ncbi:MAG: hypothetical protein IT168_32205 [Bryobacterales bacterium]|nr:hypothetical protein [Bryobacterales bacterium]
MKLPILWIAIILAVPALAVDSPKKSEPARKAAASATQVKPQPKSPAKPQAKATAPAPAAVPAKLTSPDGNPQLPKGAVEVEPGLFKHSAANGEVWMYRRTPFGYSRYQPQKDLIDADKEESQYLVATDNGDSVLFERKTPFGVNKWSRKKSELSGAERLALERVKQGGANRPAAKAGQE